MTFETTQTRIPLSFTLLDDELEEGYENFTLRLTYNEADDTVRIVNERAEVSIKDDDGKFKLLFNKHTPFPWRGHCIYPRAISNKRKCPYYLCIGSSEVNSCLQTMYLSYT